MNCADEYCLWNCLIQSLAEALAGADAVPYSDLSANTAGPSIYTIRNCTLWFMLVAGMYNAVITQQIFESNVQGALDTMQEALVSTTRIVVSHLCESHLFSLWEWIDKRFGKFVLMPKV